MRLTEYEGKELFRAYGISTPRFERLHFPNAATLLSYPVLLKSQVPVSSRKAKGGIISVPSADLLSSALRTLFTKPIDGRLPSEVLAEEILVPERELYMSFSYSGETRTPIVAFSGEGGSGISHAHTEPVDILSGLTEEISRAVCREANVEYTDELGSLMQKLWRLFIEEKLQLVEINPLFLMSGGGLIAADAKVIRDDALAPPDKKSILPLGGDIAVVAAGGGASMLAIDLLMRAGGKPANYLEYSGNPDAEVTEDLTYRALSYPGLRGAWIVGGTANFTDIYETMQGVLAGLRKIVPKPQYPIVIRRDGPRQKEAKELLIRAARDEGFNIYVFDPELSMADSASFLCKKVSST